MKNWKPVVGACLLAVVLLALWWMRMQGIDISLAIIQSYRMDIQSFLMQQYLLGILIYVVAYAALTTVSFPFLSLVTVLGGFVFGPITGTIIVTLAATLGATAAFLLNRFFFYDYMNTKFGARLAPIQRELQNNGSIDLLFIRFTPLFPFWLVTLAASVSGITLRDFILATFIGIVPFTFVYVNAGTQLANIQKMSDILSLPVIVGISLLILIDSLPFLYKRMHKK